MTTELRGNRVIQAGQRKAQALQEQLANPSNWPALKKRFVNVRLSGYNLGWMANYERESGLRSHNECLTHWVESIVRCQELALPASSQLVLADDRPDCLSGGSGTGKTLWITRVLLQALSMPTFILDMVGEYNGIKKIALPDLFTLDWARAPDSARYRFVPNNNSLLAEAELSMLFQRLNVVKTEGFTPGCYPSGSLSRWCLITEESHRLARNTGFMDFLSESRKFCRKIIVVSNNPAPFAQTCRVLIPPPLEELLKGKN